MNPKSGNRSIVIYIITIPLLFLLFLASSPAASETITAEGIRYWSSPEYTRIVIDLSGPVEFSKDHLSNPERVYFDLKNTTMGEKIDKNLSINNGILKAVRASQFDPYTVRIVLDLGKITDFKVFLLDNPSRLVIDVYGTEKKVDKSETTSIKRRIVIDPGHGGHDPGAIGPNGLCEKDVVLDIALKLKEILSADPLNEVFLTRETDVFIPLEERTAIANKKGADLFVSIHANADPKRRARGIETYLLNWSTDEEALKVAARENAISLKKMKEINQRMDILEIIKSDLIRQNKRDESIKLAHYVQKSLVSTLNNGYHYKTVDLGVKQALFYVLLGAQMPSILVEVSFISNPREEKLLSDESYRMEIAQAISKGLNIYIISTPSVQKVAGL
jgi:N-acetylmuramoyl-L-alanine amidase